MGQVKQILCLANSRKHNESCVAGREVIGRGVGAWVRPVSARAGHGVSTVEQTLVDGSLPAVLDVITISFSEYAPADYQTENWLLDPAERWERTGRWTYDDAVGVVEHPATLWTNDGSSSVGIHDRVPVEDLSNFDHSITLVQVQEPTVVVSTNPWSRRTEVRLRFRYRGVQHELKITDPRYHDAYVDQGTGEYALHPQTIATVSLAEPWAPPGGEVYSYKVVAAILEPQG